MHETFQIRSIIIAILIAFCLSSAAHSDEKSPNDTRLVLGYPGSIWGLLSYDDDKLTGSGAMFNLHQGIDWFMLPGKITVGTFAEYRYRSRTENKTYFDAEGPAVGIEFRKSIFTVAYSYYWEYFPVLQETSQNRELSLTWFYGWDLDKNGSSGYIGLPGSWWSSLLYDAKGLNGSGGMGFINQGINWFKLPGDIIFNTFVEYRHMSRTENQLYYDSGGPVVGAEFQKGYFRFGVDYYWQRLPLLNESSNKYQVYLTWYYWWNLKNI